MQRNYAFRYCKGLQAVLHPASAASMLAVIVLTALADDTLLGPIARTKPLEPADALRSFEVQPGFRIELVACEPMIRSPVAIDFDEHGRLYVAEYPEYNQQANPGSQEKGSIKLLEDLDGDGRFDKATVFADNLHAPVALACWDGGVFVGIVPDMWFFKDENGDGRADVKRRVLTGFDRDKAGEAMLNSFRWGVDNRFTIATGLAGGQLRRADRPESSAVSIRNQNVRFDPLAGDFSTTSGGGQHGLTFDDWGDTFTCENSHPIQFLAYDGRYLASNPHVEAPSPLVDINAAGRHPNLRRISPPEPWRAVRTRLRTNKQFDGPDEGGQPFGFFTGATGITIYRGDAWPAEYRGQVFVGEVANNLVYRAKLAPHGLGWSAIRADSTREFLASRDTWFRPVQFANGPDGSLYVVDMYRELIETVESMPPTLLKHVDVAGGIHRGRIYRVVSDGFRRRSQMTVGSPSTEKLVQLLTHRNGWHRDTASRLLYARQDKNAAPALRTMLRTSDSPDALHRAQWALAGLNELSMSEVLTGLNASEPRLREHSLRLAEVFATDRRIQSRMHSMADDVSPRVRFQLAFSLGSLGQSATDGLARLARRDADNEWMRFAILTSSHACASSLFRILAEDDDFRKKQFGRSLLKSLAIQIVAANRNDEVKHLGVTFDDVATGDEPFVREIVQAMLVKACSPPGNAASELAGRMTADALKNAADASRPAGSRVDSLRLLGATPFPAVNNLVRDCLTVQQPTEVQIAALQLLFRHDDASVPMLVIDAWPGMSPAIRATATETLFSRPGWVRQFLDAVAAGSIRTADVEPARIQFLLNSRDGDLRTRAAQVFRNSSLAPRQKVLDKYRPALQRQGDVVKGKAVFQQVCSTCHRLDNHGTSVGPDLSTIRSHAPETVLINILDPNREVLPKYFQYQLTTKKGVTISGQITSESAGSVSIRRADGTSISVSRAEIDEMASIGISAMPEGLESQIDVAGMADLLAYLRNRP